MTKVIAFHLPQFHSFPENDEWWGKGFTEWTNVKKATPIYPGHHQPRIPLDYDYYNMLDRETRERQSKLAKQYGIYGFCYYHYWFDGKLLMEQPCEKLLEEKDIDLPFCFCWANEPWTRAWDGKTSVVLMAQRYGEEKEWQEHFEYLLPFFQDQRYIKIDNAPMFVIYRANSIPNCDKMIRFWNEACKTMGFSGIHIVEELNTFQGEPSCEASKAVVEFEPLNTQRIWRKHIQIFAILRGVCYARKPRIFKYDDIWQRIIRNPIPNMKKKVYLGAFIDWDNSPRRQQKPTIYKNASPEKFERYFTIQLKKAEENQIDFVFINAWNEWAEGTYLEPDEKNGYRYLEAVRRALGVVNAE